MKNKTLELSPVEKELIDIEVEKSKLNREKSMLVLNKALFLYFSFLFVGVIGFINNYLSRSFLNILVMMGLCVLIIGIVPYIKTMTHEEDNLNRIIADLRGRMGDSHAK